MNYVLSNTVQMSDGDGRYSPGNKAWAKGISINNSDEDRRKFYVKSRPEGDAIIYRYFYLSSVRFPYGLTGRGRACFRRRTR